MGDRLGASLFSQVLDTQTSKDENEKYDQDEDDMAIEAKKTTWICKGHHNIKNIKKMFRLSQHQKQIEP